MEYIHGTLCNNKPMKPPKEQCNAEDTDKKWSELRQLFIDLGTGAQVKVPKRSYTNKDRIYPVSQAHLC